MSEEATRTKSTVDRLKGMIAEISLRLSNEREQHVIRLNTIATEAVDIQREYIQVLEARVVGLEAENRELRRTLGQIPTDTEST